MLEARNITSRYGPVTALHNADFTLAGGGGTSWHKRGWKINTGRVIAGMLSPNDILLEGEDITRIAIHDRAGRGIGLVKGRRVFPDQPSRKT